MLSKAQTFAVNIFAQLAKCELRFFTADLQELWTRRQ